MATPLVLNWVTNQPIPLNSTFPVVNVVSDFGAKADGVTDDSTAINNAINSTTNGGIIFFPSGVYAIGSATAITMPTNVAVTLMGTAFGDSGTNIGTATGGTILKATASITSIITTGTAFQRGSRITSMTLDGNALAQYCLKMDGCDDWTFDNLNIVNATLINFRLGNGTTNTQENRIYAIKIDNPNTTVLASLPTYNFECNGVNNCIMQLVGANAKTANIHSSSTAGGNYYTEVHGYDFFSGAAQAPTYNFLIDGSEETFVGWEADGSSSVNVQCNGFGNIFTAGLSQFQGLTAHKGLVFANNTYGNMVYGNIFYNSAIGQEITQAGVGGASTGNFFFGNFNYTSATSCPDRMCATTAISNLPTPTQALAGCRMFVNNNTSSPAFLSVATSGGSTAVPVFCDGGNWLVG